MKKLFFPLVLLATTTLASCSSAKPDFSYEMVCQGVGTQGSNLLKVYSYAKNNDKAIEAAKKNAVHGILFKGIVGGNGCAAQPAIVKPNEQAANEVYFKNFFESGAYLRYVSLSNDGTISGKDRLKVGKYYKIGVIVSVNKHDLRKQLEADGIIRKLGF